MKIRLARKRPEPNRLVFRYYRHHPKWQFTDSVRQLDSPPPTKPFRENRWRYGIGWLHDSCGHCEGFVTVTLVELPGDGTVQYAYANRRCFDTSLYRYTWKGGKRYGKVKALGSLARGS